MAYINLDYLKEFTGDDPELLKDAVQRYLKNSPVLLEQLNEGFQNEDWEKVSFSAHTLFSSTQIVGLEQIRDQLKKVEHSARENTNPKKEIEKDIEQINEVIEASYNELKTYT